MMGNSYPIPKLAILLHLFLKSFKDFLAILAQLKWFYYLGLLLVKTAAYSCVPCIHFLSNSLNLLYFIVSKCVFKVEDCILLMIIWDSGDFWDLFSDYFIEFCYIWILRTIEVWSHYSATVLCHFHVCRHPLPPIHYYNM